MMKRYLTFLLPLALVPATGAGQRFFDDFDGDRLGEHWFTGNPKGGWIYSMHDSLLDVERFEGFSASQWIIARIPEYDDFDMRAVVGWTDEPIQQGLMVMMDDGPLPNGPFVAHMSYYHERSDEGDLNLIQARFNGGPARSSDGPANGFHEFRITRSGGHYAAYLDGDLFLEGGGTDVRPRWLTLYFGGLLNEDADLFVDRVSVVPEPASVGSLAAAICLLPLARRRRIR